MASYLNLPGASGAYASTPDAAPLDITGDIEIVVRVAATDWTPAVGQCLVAKRTTAEGLSWQLNFESPSGRLNWSFRSGGVDRFNNGFCTPSTLLTDASAYWIKFTRVAATGVIAGYSSADQATEPTSWDQTWTASGTRTSGNIDANNAIVEIGSNRTGAGNVLNGRMYRVIVRSGIGGTTVFDADFTDLVNGTTSFAEDANGATVTINGTASIIATDDSGSSHSSGGRRPRKPTKEELAIIKAAQRRPVLQQLIDKRQPVTHVASGTASFGFDATAAGVVSWSSADDDEQLLAVF